MLIILLWLSKLIHPKAPRFKLVIELELQSPRIFVAKVTLTIGKEKYMLVILCWKLIPGQIDLKNQTEKNNRKLLQKKNFCWVTYKWVKVKVVLDLSNYGTKKNQMMLQMLVDASNLGTSGDFIDLKLFLLTLKN